MREPTRGTHNTHEANDTSEAANTRPAGRKEEKAQKRKRRRRKRKTQHEEENTPEQGEDEEKGPRMTIMPEGQRDALEVLASDHRALEGLLAEYRALTDPGQRGRLIERVTVTAVQHTVAEEEYLYPVVRAELPDGDAIADADLRRQAAIEATLNELDGLDPANERFDPLVRRLADEVAAHIRFAEESIFPGLRDRLDAEQRMGLGLHLLSAKRTAPTHPHPEAPDKPPLNKLINPGVGLVDRVRDWLSGRTR